MLWWINEYHGLVIYVFRFGVSFDWFMIIVMLSLHSLRNCISIKPNMQIYPELSLLLQIYPKLLPFNQICPAL